MLMRALLHAVVLLSAGAAAVLVFPSARIALAAERPAMSFADAQGRPVGLDAFKGRVVILDFWATWCKPCREEFPVLDRLQARLGARGLAVVAVCVNREGLPAVDAFYDQLGIVNLAKYTGAMNEVAKVFGLRGLPTTLVLDRNGEEVLRLDGSADWEGAEMDALLARLLDR
jgi:thiol-disulfide isomerase/thioredoxin